MELLKAIRTVLIRPTHPGNVGAAARALKNMGLEQLCLVAPENYPGPEATARAADADDILARAQVCARLDEAIGDCHFVVGTSARSRRISWPFLDPAACATRLLAEAQRGPVAVMFGQERTGLTNDELDRCHALVHIPTNPDYPSINLGCAVQIIAYEVYRTATGGNTAPVISSDPPARIEDIELFYRHMEEVLTRIKFIDPENPRLLMRRLRRLFNRAQLDRNEVNILRGILTAVEQSSRELDINNTD
ncbi:MAG: RNA methyltransferase [Gammaproteobacteria bacterium]|nr:RNA methyltransferase [Gammaproteobacteria bacterium]